jgi:hypothetical protein
VAKIGFCEDRGYLPGCTALYFADFVTWEMHGYTENVSQSQTRGPLPVRTRPISIALRWPTLQRRFHLFTTLARAQEQTLLQMCKRRPWRRTAAC